MPPKFPTSRGSRSLVAPRTYRLSEVAVRTTIFMGVEVPDAFGRQPWLRSARSRRIRASDSAGTKRQDTKGFKDAFASSRFVCLLPRFSHRS